MAIPSSCPTAQGRPGTSTRCPAPWPRRSSRYSRTHTAERRTSSTTASLVLFERQGNVYRGQLQRDGAAIMFVQADGTTANYSLRFNQQAIDSLKAAVAF